MSALAQQITIKGNVKEASGEPIIGANVLVTGTTNGTITDLDGNFEVYNVDENATIEVSFIGYHSQTLKVSAAPMNIILIEDTQALDELIVIGYGVQKKSVVTASIARVSADDLGVAAPVRVDNALKGLASGVQVSTTSGQPGASAKVRIRGTGTINNSDPLYIIDGMAVDGGIDYLNPSDIESIEVLKDAASGAVYGARAANGVVLVTTKSGKEGKTRVTYDFSYGFQSPWRERSMLNATEYATLMNEASNYAGEGDIYANPSQVGKGTNWQKGVFNSGAPVQNHQVSVSGASEKISYFLSLGYYDQEGIVGGNYGRSNYNRISIRSNTTYNIFDESRNRNWLNKMTVGVNIGYSRIKNSGVEANSVTGSPLGNAMFMSPLIGVYAEDEAALQEMYGHYGDRYKPLRDPKNGKLYSIPGTDFNEITNPLAELSLPGEKHNSDKFVSTFYAELTLWDNLKFKSSYGTDLAFWGTDGWQKANFRGPQSITDRSKVWSEMNRGSTWQVENILTYDKTFNKHSFAVVLGQSAKKYTGRKISGDRFDLTDEFDDKANLDFATGLASNGDMSVSGGRFNPNTLASYFGRLTYNYDERYMFQATIRRDGSSSFGPNNKWGGIPFRIAGMEPDQRSLYGEPARLADKHETSSLLG